MRGRYTLLAGGLALGLVMPPSPAAAQNSGSPSVLVGRILVSCDALGFGVRQRIPECVVERPRSVPLPGTTEPAEAAGGDMPPDTGHQPPVAAPVPATATVTSPSEPVRSAALVPPANDEPVFVGSSGTAVETGDVATAPDSAAEPAGMPEPEPADAANDVADLPLPGTTGGNQTAASGTLPPLRPADRPLALPPQSVSAGPDTPDAIVLASATGEAATIFTDPETIVVEETTGESLQVPARPPAEDEVIGTLADLRGYMIRFEPGDATLSNAAESLLLGLSERLRADENATVQIRAFAASGPSDGSGGSRIMSLYRALAVRDALMNMGVRATAIDIRALGDAAEGAPFERADIELGTR